MGKDWDAIMREIPTPPSSDEDDDLNVRSVHKNARKIVNFMHSAIPGLDETRMSALPKGLNKADFIREGLVDAFRASRQAEAAGGDRRGAPSSAPRGAPPPPPPSAREPPPPPDRDGPRRPAASETPTARRDAAVPGRGDDAASESTDESRTTSTA